MAIELRVSVDAIELRVSVDVLTVRQSNRGFYFIRACRFLLFPHRCRSFCAVKKTLARQEVSSQMKASIKKILDEKKLFHKFPGGMDLKFFAFVQTNFTFFLRYNHYLPKLANKRIIIAVKKVS